MAFTIQMTDNGNILKTTGSNIQGQCCCNDCDPDPPLRVTVTGIDAGNRSGSDGGGDFLNFLGEKFYNGTSHLICPTNYLCQPLTTATLGPSQIQYYSNELWEHIVAGSCDIDLVVQYTRIYCTTISTTLLFNKRGNVVMNEDGGAFLSLERIQFSAGGGTVTSTARVSIADDNFNVTTLSVNPPLGDTFFGYVETTYGLTITWERTNLEHFWNTCGH